MINAVAWGEVSSDNRYIFGCFAEMSCVIFSVEKQRTIYTTDLDPLSSEY